MDMMANKKTLGEWTLLGPKNQLYWYDGVKWGPLSMAENKWVSWGYFTLLIGVMTPFISGFWAHLIAKLYILGMQNPSHIGSCSQLEPEDRQVEK